MKKEFYSPFSSKFSILLRTFSHRVNGFFCIHNFIIANFFGGGGEILYF